MSGFEDIIGQEHIKEHMTNALTNGRVSHAYIIQGERFSGKEFVAKTFARALLCENKEPGNIPCGECSACKVSFAGNHPDIVTVGHEKPNLISVDDIRTQIVNDMSIKPYSADYKVYIMNEGEKMNVQAQNALLKTLEEPPAYGVIMILTTSLDALLPTILSRCVILSMRPVEDHLVKDFLMKEMQIPDYRADISVAFARGNIGRARMLASSEEFDNIQQEALGLVRNIKKMEIPDIMQAIKRITEYQMDINDYLDVLSIWYRDVLLFKATADTNRLIFRKEISAIRKLADESAYEGVEKILEALDKAKLRLKANVSFELVMELLCLTIQEN